MPNDTFSIELAQSIFDSEEQYPVDFEFAWQWCGYARKNNAKRNLLKNFLENEDFISDGVLLNRVLNSVQQDLGGRPTDIYCITVDCLKSLAMMAQTSKGKLVRQYFLECERKLKTTAKLLGVTGNGEVIDNELITNMQAKIDQLESINYELKIFIDKQLEEKKKAVIADYECFTDDVKGNPLVFIRAMQTERDEAISKVKTAEYEAKKKANNKISTLKVVVEIKVKISNL
jgi:phage anti-repressor protein